jgi:hypothetical protein
MNFKKYWWLWLSTLLLLSTFITFVVLRMDELASTSLMATMATGMVAALFSGQYRTKPSKIALWISKKGVNLKRYSSYITLAGMLTTWMGLVVSWLDFHLAALMVIVFGLWLMFEGYYSNDISEN